MSLKLQLQEDMKTAMKARDQFTLDNVRGLISEIKKVEIDTRKEVDEAGVLTIIQKQMKMRRDALDFAKNAARADLIEQNEKEIVLLQKYLGDTFTGAKLEELIQGIIAGGATQMGAIMAALQQGHKGRYDGKEASEVIKKLTA